MGLLTKSDDTPPPAIAFLYTELSDSGEGRRKIHQLYLQICNELWKPGVD